MSEAPDRGGGGAGPTARGTIAAEPAQAGLSVEPPRLSDAPRLWEIARDSGALDLNSSYAYLLWCHDFADTSVVARHGDDVIGFVTGYLRPNAPDTLMVWQVAVDPASRGGGVAGRLLDGLLDRLAPAVRYLETTVTQDNTASNRMFRALADRRHAEIDHAPLFRSTDFPDRHETEYRYRIGPFQPSPL
jgi:diaminobutyrate acetyltransferase